MSRRSSSKFTGYAIAFGLGAVAGIHFWPQISAMFAPAGSTSTTSGLGHRRWRQNALSYDPSAPPQLMNSGFAVAYDTTPNDDEGWS